MTVAAEYEYHFEAPLLQVRDVSLSYHGESVLHSVNLEIRDVVRPHANVTQGQVVGLLGPSGAGKTQLFRIMAGLNEPTSGGVFIGENLVPVEAGMVGVVAQSYPLFGHRKVLNNLTLAGKQAGMDDEAARDKAFELLEKFGMPHRAYAWPDQLSGGQRQRVAIMQQMMCTTDFILMDEPFSGLDPERKVVACNLIRELALTNEHITIIVVSHDIEASMIISDTLWFMGRERDSGGAIIPGASIKHQINLMERGIAWRPNNIELPAFGECYREVRELFKTL